MLVWYVLHTILEFYYLYHTECKNILNFIKKKKKNRIKLIYMHASASYLLRASSVGLQRRVYRNQT